MRLRPAVLALFCPLLFAWAPTTSLGQVSDLGLISQREARQVGLERVWFTQVELDRTRTRLGHIAQHVSSTHARTVYEVTYEAGRFTFSENELDRFGDPLGKVGAKKQADEKVVQLKQAGFNPQLNVQLVPEITLYATSGEGVVQAIDGETGKTRWAVQVGKRNHPTLQPAANDRLVAVVNGSRLYVLNRDDGSLAWQRLVIGVPGAGPAVSDYLIFVPMINGALESYSVEDYREPAGVFKSTGRASIQPIVTPRSVVWPTDRGHFYVGPSNRRGIRFRLEAHKTIVAQAAYQSPYRLYMTSVDGYVYCVHENSGAILWNYSAGEPIGQAPVVIGDVVYFVTDDANLFCIESQDGSDRWRSPRITRFLSASNDRIYAIDKTGRLTVLDAQSGGRMAVMNRRLADVSFVNGQTDRIFLGTPRGLLQCLRETDLVWPVIHRADEAKPATPEVQQDGAPPPADQRDTQPEDVDVFGADPFSTEKAEEEDPFAGGAKDEAPSADDESDPFRGDDTSDSDDENPFDPFN